MPCPQTPRPGAAAAAPRPVPPTQTVNWIGVRQPAFPPSNANGTHAYGAPVVIVGSVGLFATELRVTTATGPGRRSCCPSMSV